MNTVTTTSHLTFRPVYVWMLLALIVGSFFALFLSFQAGFFVLAFMIVGWWTWLNPELALRLFIVIAPLLPMLKITQTIGTGSLIKDVIIAVLCVRLLLIPLFQKTLPYRRNVLVLPFVLLIAWASIAALRSDALILGVLRLRDILLYMGLFFAVLYSSFDREVLKGRARWFFASYLIVLALGVFQWIFAQESAVLRFDPVREIWIPRISSTLAHPSIFGQYAITGSLLALAIAAFAKDMRTRTLALGITILSLPFIFLTYSRAVWLGFAAGVGAMGLVYVYSLAKMKVSKKKLTTYISGVVVAGVIAFILLVQFTPAGGFLRSIFDPTYASNEERLTFLVRLVAPMTSSEAIVGRGLGDVTQQNFRSVDLEVYDIATGASRDVQLTKDSTLVDNQYLKTFVEMGIIGIILFCWIYARLGWYAFKEAASDSAFTYTRIIGLWGIGFLAAFVLQALFIDIWDIFPTNAAFWIVAGLVSVSVLHRRIHVS